MEQSIPLQNMIGFSVQTCQFGNRRLHSVGQLILGNSRLNLRILITIESVPVELADGVDDISSFRRRDAFGIIEMKKGLGPGRILP